MQNNKCDKGLNSQSKQGINEYDAVCDSTRDISLQQDKLNVNISMKSQIWDFLLKVIESIHINRQYDIPYLAGYSIDGKTVYIDRHLPKSASIKGKMFQPDSFLLLHEISEKFAIDKIFMSYQKAHKEATKIEREAVESEGINWSDYQNYMQKYIKYADKEKLQSVPSDLDLTPYKDEKDFQKLKEIFSTRGEDYDR